MWKSICKLSMIGLLVTFLSLPIFAQSNTIGTLIEEGSNWDGKSVVIEGEVIGDVMNRGAFSWINVADETGAIGVYIDTLEANKISMTGNYKYSGDRVQIEGTFHRALKDVGGEMAIAGESLRVSQSGEKVNHLVKTERLIVLGILSAVALLLYFNSFKLEKNTEK